jgi:hypothetical protein
MTSQRLRFIGYCNKACAADLISGYAKQWLIEYSIRQIRLIQTQSVGRNGGLCFVFVTAVATVASFLYFNFWQ